MLKRLRTPTTTNMLSKPQFNEMADTTKIGAMPINTKYDGPKPLDTPSAQGVKQPNESMSVPKPGFF